MGRGEKGEQETHTDTHVHMHSQHSFCQPSPSHVKLVHTIVHGCALQLASLPGFSITWCLRRSLAENGQPPLPAGSPSLTSQGRLAAGFCTVAGPHLLNPRGVLASCPWVHWCLIKLYPGQRALNIRRLRGSWKEKAIITWAEKGTLLRERRKGSL